LSPTPKLSGVILSVEHNASRARIHLDASLEHSGSSRLPRPEVQPFNSGDPNVPKYAVRDMDLPMGVDWPLAFI